MDLYALLWLLLPVAAASGWFAARRAFLSRTETVHRTLSSHYLNGLNYLLNEQPDKAIDVFIKLIEVDSETVETHLALGALFRRRGEVNRAIRIHQNLLEGSRLNNQQYTLALLELGQDYQRAGLLDRAESLFRELIEADCYKIYAYRQLLNIYQQEHDWDNAIKTAEEFAQVSGENLQAVIAQYHCERAEHSRRHTPDQTLHILRQALQADPACVRASLMEAELTHSLGNSQAAVRALRRVEHQNTEYLPEIIAPLEAYYRESHCMEEFAAYLRYLLGRYGGSTPVLALSHIIHEQEGKQAALEFIAGQLKLRPSIRGVARFLDLTLPETEGAARENLRLLKQIIAQLLKHHPVYKCHECGFATKTLYWQCPGCKQWNTVKPIHGIEGE